MELGILFFGLVFLGVNVVLLILWIVTKKHIFGAFIALLWLWYYVSEHKTHGSFWSDFHEDLIVSKTEDAAFNKTCMGWVSSQDNFFTIREIADFASANEWTLVDSLKGSYDSLNVRLAAFDRLKDAGDKFPYVILKEHIFKGLDPKETYCIYFFRTPGGIISIAGSDHTDVTGFAVISSGGKRLGIYHFWGEF